MHFLLSPDGPTRVGHAERALAALLGGSVMPINDLPVDPAEGGITDPSSERAVALLTEALAILDALDLSPHIGARLQEVIDEVERETGSRPAES